MTKMLQKRHWRFRIATWFWIVLVVATFFLGHNWDDTGGRLWRQTLPGIVGSGSTGSMSVAIPAMEPGPVASDFAWPTEISSDSDEATFSFYIGFSR